MIDWQRGVWERSTGFEADGRSWRMTVAGDWAPFKSHEAVMVRDPAAVYGDLLPVLAGSDLNVVNVEAVLGEAGQPIPKAGPCLRGDERAVGALQAGHFHVGTLANNHILDFGVEGLGHTLDVLRGAGVETVGAGLTRDEISRPLVREVGGVRVGIINCGEGEACRSERGRPGVHGLDVFEVSEQVRGLKSRGEAEVVVVIFHGGREYVAVPPPYVVTALRQIASCGADAVVAHHPHVPQAFEVVGDVPIAYSLGNFVFWRDQVHLYQRLGYLLHLDFRGAALVRCSMTPYVFWPEGLRVMTAAQQAWFYGQMSEAAQALGREDDVWEAWEAYASMCGVGVVLNHVRPRMEKLAAAATGTWTGAGPATAGDAQAAAQLKNAFYTPAHQTLYSLVLDRAAFPRAQAPADWAMALQLRWRDALFADNALMSGRG